MKDVYPYPQGSPLVSGSASGLALVSASMMFHHRPRSSPTPTGRGLLMLIYSFSYSSLFTIHFSLFTSVALHFTTTALPL